MFEADLRRFGARRFFEVADVIKKLRFRDFGELMILAIGSVESNLHNIVSFNEGADRGVFQINEKWHDDFLANTPGCVNGSWIPTRPNALEPNTVPALTPATEYMYSSILRPAYIEALKLDAPNATRFTLAAYNAGIGGATKGLNEGDVDKYTTGGNYSKKVVERWRAIREIPGDWGWF